MSNAPASSVTLEPKFQENAEQKTEATSQESLDSSELAAGSVIEAFVSWVPAKRVIRRQLIASDGQPQSHLLQVNPIESQVNQSASRQVSALMRALGLAHYWQRLLHERRITSVKEIAKAEGMSLAQVNRVLRLTLLAPLIIEWLVRSNDSVLEDITTRPWPSCWATQMRSVSLTD